MSKKLVLFGGGTGLSNVLAEIRNYDVELTAVVTISDNGGSTGKIRNFYDIPAPGDIRRCALALSKDPKGYEVMNYRFDQNISNHTVGNLILTALADMYGSMELACREYCNMLGVKHTILPISNNSLQLCATMESGAVIRGEHQITTYPEPIEKLFYEGEAQILNCVLEKVQEADGIIFSCGSLYTSLISNLLFPELIEVLNQSSGKIIYICNLMTQHGETDNYLVSDHIDAINKHLDKHQIDCVIANNNYDVNQEILNKYNQERSKLVKVDKEKINTPDIIVDNFLIIDKDNHIRHDMEKICANIAMYLNI